MPMHDDRPPRPHSSRPGAVHGLPWIGLLALLSLLLLVRSEGAGSEGLGIPFTGVADPGIPVTSEVVIRSCGSCHAMDDEGRMGRVSFIRKTPEGWQSSLRRMVALHGVQVNADDAREIVRYLATNHGLAPEELEPGRFEVERRLIDFTYQDRDTERTCVACHSMGRVITERRTEEEWDLLIQTHRALYPLVDRQAFYSGGGTPVEQALAHLSRTYPLDTPEWAAWAANLRPARVEGSWLLSGHEPGRGAFYGEMEIRPVPGRTDEFTTEASYTYADDGSRVIRTGMSLVYTGYQWRGRSNPGGEDELREVMTVDRAWSEMTGRWFTGPHDEFGMDVRLRRVGQGPAPGGVYPSALRRGEGTREVRLHGANLPADLTADDVDLGPGVSIRAVSNATPEGATLEVEVAPDAPVGRRDAFVRGAPLTDAVFVHDRVDAIRVTPRAGLARIGGIVVPKQYQQFEAIAYLAGADGVPGTADDIELGPVQVDWHLEEYPSTYDDNDVDFVGEIDASGLFTPAVDGPNPERSGNRNNIGTVWVVATYRDPAAPPGSEPLTARSYLVVTAPLHIRWDDSPLRPPDQPEIP